MSSSQTSSRSTAASGSYRILNLKKAHIFINEEEKADWPEWVQNFADSIVSMDADTPLPSDASPRELCTKVLGLSGEAEVKWMEFAATRLFAGISRAPGVADSRDKLWNAPVEVLSGELAPLSTPKPDLAFGLSVFVEKGKGSGSSPQNLPLLKDTDLDALRVHARIHPSPSQQNTPYLAFPSIIYECRSELQPIFFAENQAATAAAKALKMIEELMEAAERTDLRLPVFAMCSCGSFWRIFVAYSTAHQDVRCVDLVQIWSGDINSPAIMSQLITILARIREWLCNTFRGEIARLVSQALALAH